MDTQVEVRTDHRITTQDDALATPEDARSLHDWPERMEADSDPVTVAVMDSGIHEESVRDHPWFEGTEVTRRYDATGAGTGGDMVGHGTGVASIISENVADVELWSVRIFGSEGRTGWSVIRDAYEWLIDNAEDLDVVNMSWGARSDVSEINRLHEKLIKENVHDVVAAGNTGAEGGSPATSRKAFSAGAVDASGDLTRFTSRDPNLDNPDVAAVGKNVMMARAPGTSMGTPVPGNDLFTKASGTSFAAPYTAAAYANALYQRRQSWDAGFERAAEDIPGSKADGDGLLKLNPALGDDSPEPPEENPTADASVWAFMGRDTVFVSADWLPSGDTVAEKVGETKDSVTLKFRK